MSDEQRALVYNILAAPTVDLAGDPHEQRPLFEAMMTAQPLADDVVTTPDTLGGRPALAIDLARRPAAEGTLLYLHGGGYVMGSALTSVGLASDLARASGMRALSVDYRLAPEHRCPAAVQDAVAAYRALLERGVDPRTLAVAGDSAGGGLCVAMMVALKGVGLPLPAAAVLLSPWTDLAGTGDSRVTKAEADQILTARALDLCAQRYLGPIDPADPVPSPVNADLTGLPPMLVQVGSDEILLDDATRLAARAAAADVAVTLDVIPRMPHVFQVFAGLLDEGRDAITRAGGFLRQHVSA